MSSPLTLAVLSLLTAFGACQPARGGDGATSTAIVGGESSAVPSVASSPPDTSLPVAYLAGGCFWCTEASFERIRGVQAVVSGYSGGAERDPSYKQVASGATGHAEAIAVYYDPAVVSYRRLLDVFFVAHDPTTLNRQGPDIGPQYRSAIFYQGAAEQVLAKAVIDSVNAAGRYPNPIVTELVPFERFYEAEAYHQDYLADPTNPNQSYVQNVSWPKVRKVEKEFAALLKPEYAKGN